MTKFKSSLIALAIVAPLAALPLPSMADVDLVVKIAPPAPRVEPVPAPRVGYVWAPGYWNWNGRTHVWVAGTWHQQRPGYVYAQPVWVQRDGQWHFSQGKWARQDADHDGVKNANDHDRDGDGIRNKHDNHPNVPH